jgi:hypothetical protein
MYDLPRSSFSLVDIRHAMLTGDLMPAQLELCNLNADFVGDVPGDVDELLFQLRLPV